MSTRESRISRCRAAVHRFSIVAPLRLTIASTTPRAAASSSPAAGFHDTSELPLASRRTSLTTSWPAAPNDGTSAPPDESGRAADDDPHSLDCADPPGSRCPRYASLGFVEWRARHPRAHLASATACAPRCRSRRARSSSASPSASSRTLQVSGVPATIVMSATTFAGAAQFAAISVLGAGGTVTAADPRGRLPERALRRDQHDGRVDLPRGPAAAPRRVAGDRRRVVGALGTARTVRVADPRRRRARLLRALGGRARPPGRSSAASSPIRTRSGSTRRSPRSSSRSRCPTSATAARARRLRSPRRSRSCSPRSLRPECPSSRPSAACLLGLRR